MARIFGTREGKLSKKLQPFEAQVGKPFGKTTGSGIKYRYLSSAFTPYEGSRLVNRPSGGGTISSNPFASGYQSYGSVTGNTPGSQYDIKNPMKGAEVRPYVTRGGHFSTVGGNRPFTGNKASLKAAEKGAKATAKAFDKMDKGYAKANYLDVKGDVKAKNILNKIDSNTSDKKKARLEKRAEKVDKRLNKRAQRVLARKMKAGQKNKFKKKIGKAGVEIQSMANHMYSQFQTKSTELVGRMNQPKSYKKYTSTSVNQHRRRFTDFSRISRD
jgi:hypothetical protein